VPKLLADSGPIGHCVCCAGGGGHQEATAYAMLEQATTYAIAVHEDEDEGSTIHNLCCRASHHRHRRASHCQKARGSTTQVGRHQALSVLIRAPVLQINTALRLCRSSIYRFNSKFYKRHPTFRSPKNQSIKVTKKLKQTWPKAGARDSKTIATVLFFLRHCVLTPSPHSS
jgi:hypothetical protein